MTTEYLDFELQLGTADKNGDYPLSVIQSPAGNAHGVLTLPATPVALALQPWCTDPAAAKQIGKQLFDALLTNSGVFGAYAGSQSAAIARGKNLRIKLRIVDPALAVVPWELLFDARLGEFLALDHATAIVRYAEVAQPVQPLTVTLPLRILGMAVSPRNRPSLDVAAEKRAVQTALKVLLDRGDVELVWLDSGTKRELRQALQPNAKPWHVFHFVGHGGYDDGVGGYLIFADKAGDADLVTADQLARIVAAHDPMRLVLLNACRGATADSRDLFSGIATTLIRRGRPAVIAMQSAIPDTAGYELARSFYEGLADGLSVEGALTNARISESIEHGERADWAAPVLYLRAPDGVLFAIDRDDKQAAPSSEFASRSTELAYLKKLFGDHAQWARRYTPLPGVTEVEVAGPPHPHLDVPADFFPPEFDIEIEGSNSRQRSVAQVAVTDLRDAVATYRRLVILGEPGSGKTTTLKMLCRDYALAAQQDAAAPLPLLVSLGGYNGPESAFQYVAANAGDISPYLPSYLQAGRVVLLLDALNEMPREGYGERVRRVQALLDRYPTLPVIVTCRALDYVEALKLQKLEVKPLDRDRQRTYLRHYLGEADGDTLFWRLGARHCPTDRSAVGAGGARHGRQALPVGR